MQNFFENRNAKQFVTLIENRPIPLTSRSWVEITASSAKFTWLARHRKSETLGNNGNICLLWMGKIILGTKNISLLGAL